MTRIQDEEARLLALCDDVVARAKRRGATGAEAYAEHVLQVNANIEQSGLKGASAAEHEAVGIRLFVGDRIGFAYVNRLDDAALDDAIADALEIARASPGDSANGLVDPLPLRNIAGLWNDGLASLGADDVVRMAAEMLEAARDVDGRVSIDTGSFGVTQAHNAIASTAGVRAAGSESAASYGLFGMAVDGDEVGSFDHVNEGVRMPEELGANRLARRFSQQVLALLNPVEGRSYRGRALFSAEAFDDIFLDALLDAIEGDAVNKGGSRLRDKLGKRIATPGLTIIDDGTLAGGIGSGHFDREGLPHRRTVLVGDGTLHTFLYDGKSARRAGTRPTGHAQGSARSLPSVGTTNLRVMPGAHDDAALLRELGTGLFIGRFSGNVDPVSGDFSGVAKGSFLVEDGVRGRPVKETLVAGNAFDLLDRIVAMGSKTHQIVSLACPWVLIDGVDITAG